MKLVLFVLSFVLTYSNIIAQVTTFPENGAPDYRSGYYAIKSSNIQIAPDSKVENAWLLIKDGRVQGIVGEGSVPKDAVQVDLGDYYIYPSFLDVFSDYGMPELKSDGGSWDPQFVTDKEGAFAWNEALKSEISAKDIFKQNEKAAAKYRKEGVGAVVSHVKDGIARGSATAVSLAKEKEHNLYLKEKAASFYSFDKGTSSQNYPGSLMGSIALLRQTYLDGQWYAAKNDDEVNLSLEAWNENLKLPAVFDAGDALDILRADKVGDEFGVQYIIKEDGTAYQRLKEIKESNATLIVSLSFPDAFDVSDPFDAINVNLEEMKHWELAPSNAKFLNESGIPFVFTADGLDDKTSFFAQVKKTVEAGLPEEVALKALTTLPAQLFGLEKEIGTLEKGKRASFIVTDKPLFDASSQILQTWVDGQQHILVQEQSVKLGKYDLTIGADKNYILELGGSLQKPSAKVVVDDSTNFETKIEFKNSLISIAFSDDEGERYQLSGVVSGTEFTGKGQLSNGDWFDWSAKKAEDETNEKTDDESEEKELHSVDEIIYPFVAYGTKTPLEAEEFVVKNATVWTNEAQGILEETDVWVKNGKIFKVGKGLSADGVKTVDGTGKHLTSGIIDEHSHIAISNGVNEWTQASSAEVRIGDVVNSEDVNIYRQLSGGVTASQLLHGSANPIGGQSALIKLRWGKSPEEMKIKGADGFIKFALGENVKQSNWGEKNTVRFPQTRMGVEQVYVDYFSRAKAYEKTQKEYSGLSSKAKKTLSAPRKDLDLEAVVEILNSKRFVTCHSYVQSEINMLMKVAEDFGFRINTFTHILEGYKVADKLREHGAAGSTFADWWAYKYEVIDAIPYNANILTEQGVLTGINSDDAEMGRRLNQEAAKSIKYGGMSKENAWKLVTLNPAKMLHLDDRMGSIKVGKDADLVLWSAEPLSVYAQVEHTYVDGICYYSKERDAELRAAIKAERARLIQKMLDEKLKGKPTQKPKKKEDKLYHCLTIEGVEMHHEH